RDPVRRTSKDRVDACVRLLRHRSTRHFISRAVIADEGCPRGVSNGYTATAFNPGSKVVNTTMNSDWQIELTATLPGWNAVSRSAGRGWAGGSVLSGVLV